ncbi:transposase [Variovorax sp. J31P207]|uniref:transposase n=1 Tax=Variovorax sp. J31P207 TaxID=3053510 RepID=UPI0025766208|nr:transposase [Variovorax sp. J31P207]MDM0065226.1 transposase [Variovorax sp. J31P207]
MELMQNGVIRITAAEPLNGTFRIVAIGKDCDSCALACIAAPASAIKPSHGGRKHLEVTKNPRKRPPQPLVGKLIWTTVTKLEKLSAEAQVLQVDLLNDSRYYNIKPRPMDDSASKEFEEKDGDPYENEDHKARCLAMAIFLDIEGLQEQLLKTRSLAGLVEAAKTESGRAACTIYKYFSLLCRYGFEESSLIDRYFRSGARGISRPCDPGGRKKAGRWTNKQRKHYAETQKILPPEQPGICTDWQALILAGDALIQCPKPDYPDRAQMILDSHFFTQCKEVDGCLVPIPLPKGAYPSRRQIARFLERQTDRLVRLAQSTTEGHMTRAKRGLKARSWKGVPGPGHTYAIDSSVGDVYLRSTVNRAWFVGRPIVYIVVDVWSTAIVGFHVCLSGPSWATAKLAIFSAAAPPSLMGELWHYVPIMSLHPSPTLSYYLWCDRGEYLSKGAKQFGVELEVHLQYMPPYRPDLRGINEVLHRVAKNKIFLFVPGAIDARRPEYELKHFNPKEGVLTVPEFATYLYIIFTLYNLNADRSKRLDTNMLQAGVFPSPAGLWSYGHAIGAGVQRATTLPQLITSLLPGDRTAIITRSGVNFAGLDYSCPQIEEEQWTAYARNFGRSEIPALNFPGTVSRIWTPNPSGNGLLDLQLSDFTRATRFQTLDDVMDAFYFGSLNNADYEHRRVVLNNQLGQISKLIISQAEALTNETLSFPQEIPNVTKARKIEVEKNAGLHPSTVIGDEAKIEESDHAHIAMMNKILGRMSHAKVSHH